MKIVPDGMQNILDGLFNHQDERIEVSKSVRLSQNLFIVCVCISVTHRKENIFLIYFCSATSKYG